MLCWVCRYETFFGPGVTAECLKVDAEKRLVAIKLTTLPANNEASSAAASNMEKVENA